MLDSEQEPALAQHLLAVKSDDLELKADLEAELVRSLDDQNLASVFIVAHDVGSKTLREAALAHPSVLAHPLTLL